jgi:hypothetical protein
MAAWALADPLAAAVGRRGKKHKEKRRKEGVVIL